MKRLLRVASCELRVASILAVVLAMTLFTTAYGQDAPAAPDPAPAAQEASPAEQEANPAEQEANSPAQETGSENETLLKGLGTELSPDTFELYYNGKNLYMELNRPVRVEPVKTPADGKSLFVLRHSPYQRARMNSFQFLYPYPSRAFDDESGSMRVVRVYTERGYAITITDFEGSIDSPESAKKALEILSNSIKQQLAGKLENPELVTINFAPTLENASVIGVRIQLRIRYEKDVKDQDGKDIVELHNEIYETIGMTVSGEGFFATIVIQMFNRPFSREVQDEVLTMLKSFESNNN